MGERRDGRKESMWKGKKDEKNPMLTFSWWPSRPKRMARSSKRPWERKREREIAYRGRERGNESERASKRERERERKKRENTMKE